MKLIFPSTVFAFLCILWLKAISPASSGIADTDFFWHIAYGQWMIEHGALPPVDTFSWTMPGAPYQLTQWLGELIMGVAFNNYGLHGTKILAVALAATTIGFSWMAARRYLDTSTALGVAVLCNLVQIVTPMRPQLFTFACLAILSYLAMSWITTKRLRYLVPIPLLMALWVNLHGAFVVGIAYLGLLCLGQGIELFLVKDTSVTLRNVITLSIITGISVVATLINPYGIDAWLGVIMIGGLKSSTVISEWMPINLTTYVGWLYLLNLVPYIAVLAISGIRSRPTHGLLATFFLIFGYAANRQLAMLSAVMAPLFSELLAKTPQYQKMKSTVGNPSRPLIFGVSVLLMAFSFAWIQNTGDRNWENNLNLQYPVNATTFLIKNGLTNHVLSDTLEASYLIFKRIPVFIDGRMDLYKDHFFFEYYLAAKAAPGWDTFLAKYSPSTLLLRNDVALRQVALASGKWRLVYEDDNYSVLVPASACCTLLPTLTPQHMEYIDAKGGMIRSYRP